MRTREKTYNDYGIEGKEINYIKEFCRNSNEEDKAIIKNALSLSLVRMCRGAYTQ